MGFSPEQKTWLETAQNKSAEYQAANQNMEAKAAELGKITDEVEILREKLVAANAKLKVDFKDDRNWKNFWKVSLDHSMDWMNGDRDSEVDTVHDLKGKYSVDEADARNVLILHRDLVKLQKQMEDAKDDQGEPVFTARDIERELWSPLVRADIIPSNAVADQYSQEAQVFNGACEIYQKKLEEHTSTASRHETAQRVLRIGKDTVTMLGAVAGEAIKAAHFDASYISKSDKADNAKDVKALELEKAKPNGDPKKIQELTDKTDAFTKRSDQAKAALAEAKRDTAALGLAVTVVNGGLSITEKALDKKDQKKSWKVAEQVYDVVTGSVLASFDVWSKNVAVDDKDKAAKASFKTMVSIATNVMKAGLKSGKVVFRIQEIVAAKDPSDNGRPRRRLIGLVADIVANSFATLETSSGKNDEGEDVQGTDGEMVRIGVYLKTAILGSASVGDIVAQIAIDAKAGKKPNVKALMASLGLIALTTASVGAFETIGDVSRKERSGAADENLDVDDDNFFSETEDQRKLRRGANPDAMSKIAAKLPDMKSLMGVLPANGDTSAMEAKLAKILAEQEAEQKAEEISAFKKSLQSDAGKQNFIDNVKAASDAEVEALEKLIADANPSPDELQDEETARRAMASVDKLIKEAAACNARWKIITGLVNGGVGVLVAALPVAGLAASITKLATDVAILMRRSYHLNRWRKNMALTYGNSSVYGPAIKGRLTSAVVQVDQQAVRVIFDAVGVAADALKLADASGVGAMVGAAGHGVEIGNNMARALTEYGFKMQKEAEIEAGWRLYKHARANPGDRKSARKAMRWNSTLSKCVLAYGIVMDGDPIAKEVGRSCGLTPEILADQKDVCGKVVTYFQTLYSDDPVVLRRVPVTRDWHPGAPVLSVESWAKFKAAAVVRAEPALDRGATATPAIDKHLTTLGKLIGRSGDYSGVRDDRYPENELNLLQTNRASPEYEKFLKDVIAAVEEATAALRDYKPVTGPCPPKSKVQWREGMKHEAMAEISVSLTAQADMILGEVKFDLDEFKARAAEDDDEVFDISTLFGDSD